MSRGPHIIDVSIPDAPAAALAASDSDGLAAAVFALGGRVTVRITFFPGTVYEYPDVPGSIALALKADPENVFPTIRYWPGYRRVR